MNALVERVFAYIDAHYTDAISLADVAQALHYSPSYLTSVVRRRTGRPVTAWIIERRINAARERLSRTAEPVSTVAQAVGFNDSGYFRRCFTRTTGASPARWRKQIDKIVPVADARRMVR